ncbi:hypothetical protein GE09DRAFT_461123 [Coniochaeta sp. 2T2.1]|nr:hypothetical protein GE09DRAFT_461123 [Coniochaeta sp. 2T2.1]
MKSYPIWLALFSEAPLLGTSNLSNAIIGTSKSSHHDPSPLASASTDRYAMALVDHQKVWIEILDIWPARNSKHACCNDLPRHGCTAGGSRAPGYAGVIAIGKLSQDVFHIDIGRALRPLDGV